jgi:hypothetical protein
VQLHSLGPAVDAVVRDVITDIQPLSRNQVYGIEPGNIQLLHRGMSTLQVLVEEMPGLPHCSTKDGKGKSEEDPVKSSSH